MVKKIYKMEMVDEILANCVRLTGRIIRMQMSCFVNIMYCWSAAAELFFLVLQSKGKAAHSNAPEFCFGDIVNDSSPDHNYNL